MKKVVVFSLAAILVIIVLIYFISEEDYKTIDTPFNSIDTTDVQVIKVDLDKPTVSLDDLIEEVRYIALEEMEHSKIIQAEMIFIDDNLILILDGKGQKLVGFDHEGKYLFDIYKKGRGDQEYKYMEYATYDYLRKEILVVDTWKYIWYDLKGNYLRSYESEYNFSDRIALLENSSLAYFREFGNIDRSTNPADLNILDSTGRLESRFLPTSKIKVNYQATLFNSMPLTGKLPNILITPTYSEKIYQLSLDKKLELKYKVDFGPYQLPEFYKEMTLTNPNASISSVRKFEKNNDWARLIGSVIGSSQIISLPIFFKGESYKAYYNKETGAIRHTQTGKANYFDGSPLFHVTSYNDYFASWLKPKDMKRALEEGKVKNPETVEFIKGLNNRDNPVIRLVKIREF